MTSPIHASVRLGEHLELDRLFAIVFKSPVPMGIIIMYNKVQSLALLLHNFLVYLFYTFL